MKRTVGFALALGLAVSVAGCATGQGGAAAPSQAAPAQAAGVSSTAHIRDFNLRVRCPGIHLEKTKLGWSEEKIMEHEHVSKDDIAHCEAWAAAQPKGYVPPPPPGVKPKTAAKETTNAKQ